MRAYKDQFYEDAGFWERLYLPFDGRPNFVCSSIYDYFSNRRFIGNGSTIHFSGLKLYRRSGRIVTLRDEVDKIKLYVPRYVTVIEKLIGDSPTTDDKAAALVFDEAIRGITIFHWNKNQNHDGDILNIDLTKSVNPKENKFFLEDLVRLTKGFKPATVQS